jgi:uroporphyrinogen decarboxylase
MRQAGRYLPEYREVRARVGGFMDLCRNTELACEVTLQPLRRYDLDASIVFSDILTIPAAMGLGLEFVQGEGPTFERPVRDRAAVDALGVPDPEDDLGYVMDAVRAVRKGLAGKVPLIGFSGSPWTLACYMIEGGPSSDFRRIKGMMYSQPDVLRKLLGTLAESVTSYLNAQIAAGAQAVMVFDTWGGVLSPPCYREFSLGFIERVVAGLVREAEGRRVPVIAFSKGQAVSLEAQADIGADALGLDWTSDIGEARRRVGEKVAVQGNLDPCVLYADPETIRAKVQEIITRFGDHPGHVFNLGHGIHPAVNPDHLGVLIDAVHEFGFDIRK